MNRTAFPLVLLLSFLLFSGCAKESENGGISLSFTGNKGYTYTSFAATLSHARYGDPVMSASTGKVEQGIRFTSISPGTWWWHGNIQYTSPQGSSSYSFDGEIIIEKGKIMQITLED